MKVVLMGGGGYVGTVLAPELISRGHSVVIFDRFIFGTDCMAELEKSSDCEIVAGDIRRLSDFPNLFDGADAVVHLAGLSNDPSCDLDPAMTDEVNIDATRELAERSVAAGVRRFVLASSCSVYGHGMVDILDEESPTNPVSAYAVSKIASEEILLDLKSPTFEPVISRAATIFGWSPRMRFDLAVNIMTATAVRQGVVNVLGGGRQWRPFIHVGDIARIFSTFLEAPAEKVSGEIFNVGSSELNVQIIDLAKQVADRIAGAELKVTVEDDDRRTYRVQFDKLRDQLGFECKYSIADGIDEVEEHLKNPDFDPFDEPYNNLRRMKALLATPVSKGGEPLAPRFIPLGKPVFDEKEEQATLEALRSGWVTSGPKIGEFEQTLADTVNAKHVVAVTSCTAAIHLCLAHLGIGPGDEVITTPLTWPSIGNVIVNMGAKLVLADIDGDTLCIDPKSVEAAITERTRAIIPVHMAGQAADLDALYGLSAAHNIPIIEDAAHAVGASHQSKPIGSRGDFVCFSFYAIKNLTTLEGGAIATSDKAVTDRLRLLANHGLDVNAWDRYSENAVPSPPEIVAPGFKYSLGNVNAAIGVEQLKKFPNFQAVRRRLASLYLAALAEIEEIRLPVVAEPDEHAWHLMIIRIRPDKVKMSRDEIALALRQENIGTGFHFYGMHLHAYYRDTLGYAPEDLPEATAASREVLSLPLYPGMTEKNVYEVVAALKKVLAHAN